MATKKSKTTTKSKGKAPKAKKEAEAPQSTPIPDDVMDALMHIPTQGAQKFIELWQADDQIEKEQAALNARKRVVRAELKGLKIQIPLYGFVRKQAKMELADQKAWSAGVSMIKMALVNDLELPLFVSAEEKQALKELEAKREAARDAMLAAGGDDGGEEVGSTAAQIIAGSIGGDGMATVTVGGNKTHRAANDSAVPARNDEFTSGSTPTDGTTLQSANGQ